MYTRHGMTRHLRSCPERQASLAKVEKGRGPLQPIYHLLMQDAWSGDFWLHLELPGRTKLEELDHYLRAIWLECCGHLSAFEIGSVYYTQIFDDGLSWREERDMSVPVAKVFHPGLEFNYEYDFGTTTHLKGKVVRKREGKWRGKPIALMARNAPQSFDCVLCGKAAEWICSECLWEDQAGCTYCEDCLVNHECGDEMGMPIVNSPRMGMCGYVGPAEPPY